MSSEATQRQPLDSQYRVSAKAVLTSDDRVLLVNERHSDGSRFWTLPGGGVHRGETVQGALTRELREELCCQAHIQQRLDTLWYAHRSDDRTVSEWQLFHCRLRSPLSPNIAASILDARFLSVDELPPNTQLPVRHLMESLEVATLS